MSHEQLDLFSYTVGTGTTDQKDEQKYKRMNDLVKEINKHDYHYYTLDNPIITDYEYDRIYDELIALESELNVVLPNSPTRRVGGEILKGFEQHRHISRLWSLDKAQNVAELLQWADRTEKLVNDLSQQGHNLPSLKYSTELKFDGLTLVLTYQEGRLVTAATRGDGITGENVLAQVKTIRSIPLEIPFKGKLEVNGEGIMYLSAMRQYNEKAEKKLKHARNAAAGAIRNLDLRETAKRKLDAYWYNVGYVEGRTFKNQDEMLQFLRENGFKVQLHPPVRAFDSIEQVIDEIKSIDEMRAHFDFLIDGVVVKVHDLKTRELLGYTEKYPRWACAYKFDAERVKTPLISVENQIGRTGKLTPVGLIKPVIIDGVEISKATLNNYDNIIEKGLKFGLGIQVYVRRSNDVIPEILGPVDVTECGKEIIPPNVCPSCNSPLVKQGVDLYCQNFSCKAQVINRLSHFVSRDCMDIEGLSEKTLEQLYHRLGVQAPAELYNIRFEQLLLIEKFGEKRANKLIEAIKQSKERPLANFLYAIGIPEVGKVTANVLADHFETLDAIRKANREALLMLPDIGPNISEGIVSFFADARNQQMIDDLLAAGVRPTEKKKILPTNTDHPFFGKTVVITGSFTKWGRSKLADLIQSYGGKVTGSVSKKTDFLLVGENPGSKMEKALSLGITIWTEEKIYSVLSGN